MRSPILLRILSCAVGIIFILSSLFKVVDPMGTVLKVEEYMKAMGLGSSYGIAVAGALLLCAFEFLLGISLLAGVKRRVAAWLLLLFMSAMTLITLLNLTILPINDCGCFGDVIKLSNGATFVKNIVLLAAAFCILSGSASGTSVGTSGRGAGGVKGEVILIGGASAAICALFFYTLNYKPLADFGPFAPGTDIRAIVEGESGSLFAGTFLYEKNGIREEFDIDNLPDSTWSFVESHVETIEEGADADFQLKNGAGEYVASDIMQQEGEIIFSVVTDLDSFGRDKIDLLERLSANAQERGSHLYVICSASAQQARGLFPVGLNLLYTDRKTAISLNRLNGGLTVIRNGVVDYKERLTSTIW